MNKDSLREMYKQHKLKSKQNVDNFMRALDEHKPPELLKALLEESIKHGESAKAIVLLAVNELGIDEYNKLNDELNKETGLD